MTSRDPATGTFGHRWYRRVRRVAGSARRRTRRALRNTRPGAPRPVKGGADRLVQSPVFVISSVRSGSTLLRVMLNSHSQICAPHEMHLRTVKVSFSQPYTELSMKQLGLTERSLEHLLWDRVLHRELVRSGKRIVVDKTPGNAHIWARLHEAWPEARFIFLQRNPASMIASMERARPDLPVENHVRLISKYVAAIDAARAALPGVTVRYEDLTADPQAELTTICRYLGVPFEPGMLEYGKTGDHGPFKGKIGDWSDTIKSGRVQAAKPPPGEDTLTPEVRELNATWGY